MDAQSRIDQLTIEVLERKSALEQRISDITDRSVKVVAVTKGHPGEVAVAALRAGFVDLGENYAQELGFKAEFVAQHIPDARPRWHFVGRLQSNKVRLLVPHVTLWQTVDRASLVGELAKRAPGASVLCQVDLAGIAGRGGCERSEVATLVESAVSAGLDVRGLMGVGVHGDPAATSVAFDWLAGAAERLGLEELSIGMSGDLEAALRAGATMVRVGTDLFGPRPVQQG